MCGGGVYARKDNILLAQDTVSEFTVVTVFLGFMFSWGLIMAPLKNLSFFKPHASAQMERIIQGIQIHGSGLV